MEFVSEGNHVLYLWGGEMNDDIQNQVKELNKIKGIVMNVENAERLSLASYSKSKFDVILSNLSSKTTNPGHNTSLLSELIKLVKPQGKLVLKDSSKFDDISSAVKFAGFINTKDLGGGLVSCEKPNYEVGSSAKLSFAKKPTTEKSKIEKVWKIDNDDDEEEEIIDADDLLDEEDLQKPDPASLRVCGTTGKRKACKDCSCGLADELAAEKAPAENPTQKSSCGSVSWTIFWGFM